MSDIPRFIFIRSSSGGGGSCSTTAPVSPTTPIKRPSIHKQNNDDDSSSPSSFVSHQDLDAMKRMVREMSRNPELLREKCSIPQLSRSMLQIATDYTPTATTMNAADATNVAGASRLEGQDQDDDDEVMQLLLDHDSCPITNDDYSSGHRLEFNHNSSFDPQEGGRCWQRQPASFLSTPPQPTKEAEVSSTAIFSSITTPKTNDETMALISPDTSASMMSQPHHRHHDQALLYSNPSSFMSLPLFCQECNNKDSLTSTRSRDRSSQELQQLQQNSLDNVMTVVPNMIQQESFSSAEGFVTMMMLEDAPFTPMARSA